MSDAKPKPIVLDIGCGTGWAVRRIAALLEQRGQFTQSLHDSKSFVFSVTL